MDRVKGQAEIYNGTQKQRKMNDFEKKKNGDKIITNWTVRCRFPLWNTDATQISAKNGQGPNHVFPPFQS